MFIAIKCHQILKDSACETKRLCQGSAASIPGADAVPEGDVSAMSTAEVTGGAAWGWRDGEVIVVTTWS